MPWLLNDEGLVKTKLPLARNVAPFKNLMFSFIVSHFGLLFKRAAQSANKLVLFLFGPVWKCSTGKKKVFGITCKPQEVSALGF